MAELLYREDMDDVRERLTRWWNGEDIGRPVMVVKVTREQPAEAIPTLPTPEGWTGRYSTADFDYRVHLGLRACIHHHYLGEAVPDYAPDLAPNCLALFLGCHGVEFGDTVWCEPCISEPEKAQFRFDPENFYWRFSLDLGKELLRRGRGKFFVSFPDLIEGLDTLEAMRGPEAMLEDLLVRPDWVRECMREITDCYFTCYDKLYEAYRDETGGSVFWMWAPGRMSKLQCDCSAMLGPDTFGEFMVPVLREMTERLDYSMYHHDGPQALVHHDHLLSVPGLDALQWTPGAAYEPVPHRRWWPYYHKTIEAGKKLILDHWVTAEDIPILQREFGEKLKQFALTVEVPTVKEAEALIQSVTD